VFAGQKVGIKQVDDRIGLEHVIGSIRRECLDYVIALSVAGLQRVLADYVAST
jgi:hypothetical protein